MKSQGVRCGTWCDLKSRLRHRPRAAPQLRLLARQQHPALLLCSVVLHAGRRDAAEPGVLAGGAHMQRAPVKRSHAAVQRRGGGHLSVAQGESAKRRTAVLRLCAPG